MNSQRKPLLFVSILYAFFLLGYFNSRLFIQFGFGHFSLALVTILYVAFIVRTTVGQRAGRRFIVGIIIIIVSLVMGPVIFQERYPIPALLGALKVEMKLTKVVKISSDPLRYIVRQGTYGQVNEDIQIVQGQGRSEWDQDFIIKGERYRSDWSIYLGRYRIYNVNRNSGLR